MTRHINVSYDIKKTFLFPIVSSVAMGAVAFLVHYLFTLLFGLFMGSEYFINLFATMISVFVAVFVYFTVLIKSGGASEEDIRRFPKGASIAAILKRIRIL